MISLKLKLFLFICVVASVVQCSQSPSACAKVATQITQASSSSSSAGAKAITDTSSSSSSNSAQANVQIAASPASAAAAAAMAAKAQNSNDVVSSVEELHAYIKELESENDKLRKENQLIKQFVADKNPKMAKQLIEYQKQLLRDQKFVTFRAKLRTFANDCRNQVDQKNERARAFTVFMVDGDSKYRRSLSFYPSDAVAKIYITLISDDGSYTANGTESEPLVPYKLLIIKNSNTVLDPFKKISDYPGLFENGVTVMKYGVKTLYDLMEKQT